TRSKRDWSSDVCSSDLDHAGFDAFTNAACMIFVRGHHRSRQPVWRVVGQLDSFVFVLDLVHHGYRSEELFGVGAHILGDAGQHGWLIPGPSAGIEVTAGVDGGALRDRILDLLVESFSS